MANRGQVPRLLRTVFADADLVRFGFVVEKNARGEEILSETAGLNPNYIRRLMGGAPRTQSDTDPKTLLYLVLRHAALLENVRAGISILRERGLLNEVETYERELVNISTKSRSFFELLDQKIAGLTGIKTLAEHLAQPRAVPSTPAEQVIGSYLEALGILESLPTAELERLFTETLDVCAYRLDAWTTSLATARLQAMRKIRPANSYVGAYGWVENLKPAPVEDHQDVSLPGESGVRASTHNGGYIYAPSMTHGAAAAVLRNGYLTRRGGQQSPYAVDLSSARVRAALSLLDGVREGQPLSASLGYLFERGLHEAGLDQFIDDFRSKYPVITGPIPAGNEPTESIQARNVVDGYLLLLDYRKPGLGYWQGLTLPTQPLRDAVDQVLAKVDDSLDALTDLLTAESIFQMVGGSTVGASATLDAMGKGGRAPEPKIAEVPRGGVTVTQRVALILGGTVGADFPWPVTPATPRALAEPRLNAWVGQMLGNPSDVICSVRLGDNVVTRVTLQNLQLQPLDVLSLAKSDGPEAGGDSELDRRVVFAAEQATGVAAIRPVIRYEMSAADLQSWESTFPETLEVARSINVLLARTRALRPSDLMPEPASNPVAAGADLRAVELQNRADMSLSRLSLAITSLEAALAVADAGRLRSELQGASLFGIAAAFPPRSNAGLDDIGGSVIGELQARRDKARDSRDPVGQIREIFGKDFLFLPRFSPALPEELGQALANIPELGSDPDGTLSGWLAKAARVRPALDAWRRLSLYTNSLGRPQVPSQVVQLPYESNARWVGLPFNPPESKRPRAGVVSVMMVGGVPPTADEAWSGLLIDEWPEIIPNRTEDAGVVFHYDRPNSEAPQAVLIAVPPDATQPWSLELLLQTIEHTLAIAKTRGFDGEWTRSTGERDHALYNSPWLPLIFLADGDPDTTVATSFGAAVQGGTAP